MAKRRVYDEPNPFAPDVRECIVASKKVADEIPSTSFGKKKPPFQKFKILIFRNNLFLY